MAPDLLPNQKRVANSVDAIILLLQSMYIRVKRQKTTVFLQVEPTDTVLEVKQKLQALLDKVGNRLCLPSWMQ